VLPEEISRYTVLYIESQLDAINQKCGLLIRHTKVFGMSKNQCDAFMTGSRSPLSYKEPILSYRN